MGRDDALYSDAECVQVYQRSALPSLAGGGFVEQLLSWFPTLHKQPLQMACRAPRGCPEMSG